MGGGRAKVYNDGHSLARAVTPILYLWKQITNRRECSVVLSMVA